MCLSTNSEDFGLGRFPKPWYPLGGPCGDLGEGRSSQGVLGQSLRFRGFLAARAGGLELEH